MTAHRPTPRQAPSTLADAAPIVGLRRAGSAWSYGLAPERPAYLVGSADVAEIRLHDHHVSRLHCALIRCDDGALLVVDRDSRNGTFIDGVRCERAFLHDGAVLRVGRTELVAFTEGSRDAMSAPEARAALGQFFGHSRASQRSMARMLGVATSVVRALRQDLRVQRRHKR